MNDSEGLDYFFSDAEIKKLTLLLRKHEAVLDVDLDVFKSYLENYIYCSMTIEEAEIFFDENNNTSR